MQSKTIDVIVELNSPLAFHTVMEEISGSGHLSERINGVYGADFYLTQLIADCLNGTVQFHTVTLPTNENTLPEWIDFINNKQLLPLKAPALPPIKNVEYLKRNELYW